MRMSAVRILMHLTLPKKIRKFSDSNALGNLLKLHKVGKGALYRQKYAR